MKVLLNVQSCDILTSVFYMHQEIHWISCIANTNKGRSWKWIRNISRDIICRHRYLREHLHLAFKLPFIRVILEWKRVKKTIKTLSISHFLTFSHSRMIHSFHNFINISHFLNRHKFLKLVLFYFILQFKFSNLICG